MTQLTFNLIVGTLLRSGIMACAGWLVAKGALPSGSMEDWVGAVVLTILTLLWSLYEKVAQKANEKLKLEAALQSPVGTTEEEVDAMVQALK